MSRTLIQPDEFTVNPKDLWGNRWMLLSAGDFEKKQYNTMTVAWGSIGLMWWKLFAQVVVRPVRYTYEFMEKYDTFTLSVLPDKYRKAMQFCGSATGRGIDKIKEAGLTAEASTKVGAPSIREAEMIFECRKIYFEDFKRENFLDPEIESNYPNRDYHRTYYGEILAILKS